MIKSKLLNADFAEKLMNHFRPFFLIRLCLIAEGKFPQKKAKMHQERKFS